MYIYLNSNIFMHTHRLKQSHNYIRLHDTLCYQCLLMKYITVQMFNIKLVAMEEWCISIIKDKAPKSRNSPREDAYICIVGSAKVVVSILQSKRKTGKKNCQGILWSKKVIDRHVSILVMSSVLGSCYQVGV